MSHWAEVDENNVVIRVLVGDDNLPNEGGDWFHEVLGGTWVQTSYNTIAGVHYTDNEPSEDQTKAFRGNYAARGMVYDSELDVFREEQPFNSWTLNTTTYQWEAPVPMPEDGDYTWNEETQTWDAVSEA